MVHEYPNRAKDLMMSAKLIDCDQRTGDNDRKFVTICKCELNQNPDRRKHAPQAEGWALKLVEIPEIPLNGL